MLLSGKPSMWSVTTNAIIQHSNNQRLARSANPYYGHTLQAIWSHGWTDIVFEDYGGVNVDDGELLDRYQYNSYEARYTKNFRIPAFGFDFLREAQNRKHVIQIFDTQFGMIDRNVALNDEFRAGGRHPYNLGYGSIQPNTPFAGYPAWSLGGETMMIANMAYRFPLTRPEQKMDARSTVHHRRLRTVWWNSRKPLVIPSTLRSCRLLPKPV